MSLVFSDANLATLLALISLLPTQSTENKVSQLSRHTHHGNAERRLSTWQHLGIDTKPANVDPTTFSAAVVPGGIVRSSMMYVRTEHQTTAPPDLYHGPYALYQAFQEPTTTAPAATVAATVAPTTTVALTTTPKVMQAEAGKACPNLPGVVPDKDDNCVCPAGMTCYEDRNLDAAQELAGNMNNKTLGDEVIKEVSQDEVKDGCTAHGEQEGKVISAQAKYRSDCKHCKCHSTATTTTIPPFTTMAGAENTNFSMVFIVAILVMTMTQHFVLP